MKLYNVLSERRNIILPILILLLIGQLFSQNDSRLRMATLFKNSGNYEEALELYLQIYQSGRTKRQIINDIQFCYEKLKRYQDLVHFLQNVIQKFPSDLDFKVKLGKAYYLGEQREKAFQLWDELLQKHGKNAYLYRLLGNVLIELRLYERAIEVYQTGIAKTKSQYSLYRDIALLYRAQLDYGQAALSYLKYLQHFPRQFSFVNSQIIAMSSDSLAVKQMISAIENFLKRNGKEVGVRQILADLYLRNGDFENSFNIYLQLHKKAPRTNYLLQFVHKARQNEAFKFSIKGLKLLIEQTRQTALKQQYAFQIARNYYLWAKKLARQNQLKESQKVIKFAVQQIDQLLQKPIKSSYQWQAIELRGDIYFDYFEDIDQAIAQYQRFLKAPVKQLQIDRVRLKLAKSYLAKGDLRSTRNLLRKIKSKPMRHLAVFLQAELLFYEGKLTAAYRAFNQLSAQLSAGDSLKNNVLQRLLLLNFASLDSVSLSEFGRAEFLIAQKKLSQAANIFKELSFKNSPLSPRCAERAVELFARLNKPQEAQAVISHVLEHNADYINMDHLLFLLAAIQEKQQQWEKAFNTYRLVIANYPNSFFVEQARQRARLLKEKLKQGQVP